MSDKAEIRQLVEDWALWRDSAQWERFAELWHPDGWMTATWFQGPAAEFIARSREGFDHGVRILHFLGGHTSDVLSHRAVAQTKMTITQRAVVQDVEVDVVCTGRFVDLLVRLDGRWTLLRRQPVYESDRLHVLDPAATLVLDAALLSTFPEGYRHLGYLQAGLGFAVATDLPGLTGAAADRLHAEVAAWLTGPRPS